MARRAPRRAGSGSQRRARRRHARPVVPRRGVHPDVGGHGAATGRVTSARGRAATPPTCWPAPSGPAARPVAAAKRDNLLRKELAWLRRGAPARTSKPRFRLDAAAALDRRRAAAARRRRADAARHRPAGQGRAGPRGRPTRSAARGGSRTLLDDVTWRLGPGDRWGVVGVNGAGKTTLLRLLAGELRTRSRGASARQDGRGRGAHPGRRRARRARRPARRRGRRAGAAQVAAVGGKELTAAQLVERLGFTRERAHTRGPRPVRRRAAAAAAAPAARRRAERPAARRADQRPGHRHPRRAGGPARRLARHARGRLARPLPAGAGVRPAGRAARRRRRCGTCPAASSSTWRCVAAREATAPGAPGARPTRHRAGPGRRRHGRGRAPVPRAAESRAGPQGPGADRAAAGRIAEQEARAARPRWPAAATDHEAVLALDASCGRWRRSASASRRVAGSGGPRRLTGTLEGQASNGATSTRSRPPAAARSASGRSGQEPRSTSSRSASAASTRRGRAREPDEHPAPVGRGRPPLDQAAGRRAGRCGWSSCRWSRASGSPGVPGRAGRAHPRGAARTARRTPTAPGRAGRTPRGRARSRCRARRLTRDSTCSGATSRSGRSRRQASTIRSTSSVTSGVQAAQGRRRAGGRRGRSRRG